MFPIISGHFKSPFSPLPFQEPRYIGGTYHIIFVEHHMWHMYVYIYIYIFTYVIYTNICMYINIHKNYTALIYLKDYVNTFVSVHQNNKHSIIIHVYDKIHLRSYTYIYIDTQPWIYVYIHTYTYTYTYSLHKTTYYIYTYCNEMQLV